MPPEIHFPWLLILAAPALLGLGALGYGLASYRGKQWGGALGLAGLLLGLGSQFLMLNEWGWTPALQTNFPWPGVSIVFAHLGYTVQLTLVWDSLSASLLMLLHGVSFLVGVFAFFDQKGQPGASRFWALLLFFVGAMHLLLIAGNGLLLFVAWELIGLGSALLIGHKRSLKAGKASLSAFLLNRLGDAGLLGALLLAVAWLGTDALPHGGGTWSELGQLPPYIALLMGLGVSLAVLAKSGQLPLGGWLPRAMVGPTPGLRPFTRSHPGGRRSLPGASPGPLPARVGTHTFGALRPGHGPTGRLAGVGQHTTEAGLGAQHPVATGVDSRGRRYRHLGFGGLAPGGAWGLQSGAFSGQRPAADNDCAGQTKRSG